MYFQHSSQGEIRDFHGFVLVAFSNASLWQPPIHELRTVFILHQDFSGGRGFNKPVKFRLLSFFPNYYHLFSIFLLSEKPWRQTSQCYLCWRSAVGKWTRNQNRSAVWLRVRFPARKRTTVTPPLSVDWNRPACGDLHPSPAKLNAKRCEKRICWRDSLISRMCDHTLKLCTFPFQPCRPRGLLLRIDAPPSFASVQQACAGFVMEWRWRHRFIDGNTIIPSNEA